MTSENRRKAYTAVGAVALTVCLGSAVSACTSSPSSAHPAIFSPGASASGPGNGTSASPTGSPSGVSSGSRSASGSPSASGSSASASSSPSSSPTSSPSASFTYQPSSAPATHSPSYPAAAPQTGGGGTSGLQDGLLFGVGGLAVLAGGGSLALRRRFKDMARRDS